MVCVGLREDVDDSEISARVYIFFTHMHSRREGVLRA